MWPEARAKRYPYRCGTKGCSVVFKQLVIRPFWADFDLRDRPPVYKTAALPIELRRRRLRRLAQANKRPTPEWQPASKAGADGLFASTPTRCRPLFVG